MLTSWGISSDGISDSLGNVNGPCNRRRKALWILLPAARDRGMFCYNREAIDIQFTKLLLMVLLEEIQ